MRCGIIRRVDVARKRGKMKWRKLPMSRDNAEMTSCGRGTIRLKRGTSTVWKVRVKIGDHVYGSDAGFTKALAKEWVEGKINEKTNI